MTTVLVSPWFYVAIVVIGAIVGWVWDQTHDGGRGSNDQYDDTAPGQWGH